jgi:hypothetical protein
MIQSKGLLLSEKYAIKRLRAVKIEELPALEAPAPAPANILRIGPLGRLEPFQYTNYEWPCRTSKKGRKRFCVLCNNEAKYKAYFQENGYQKLEKYCSECLHKWVFS